jgi:hypothetical protein
MKAYLGRPLAACSVAVILVWVGSSAAQDSPRQRWATSREESRAAAERVSLPAPAAEKAEPSQSPKDKVARLERENAALRARVKDLEAQVDQLKRRRTVTVVPQPGAGKIIPPDWKPVPFGGGVYYIVPLERGADRQETIETPAMPAARPK